MQSWRCRPNTQEPVEAAPVPARSVWEQEEPGSHEEERHRDPGHDAGEDEIRRGVGRSERRRVDGNDEQRGEDTEGVDSPELGPSRHRALPHRVSTSPSTLLPETSQRALSGSASAISGSPSGNGT